MLEAALSERTPHGRTTACSTGLPIGCTWPRFAAKRGRCHSLRARLLLVPQRWVARIRARTCVPLICAAFPPLVPEALDVLGAAGSCPPLSLSRWLRCPLSLSATGPLWRSQRPMRAIAKHLGRVRVTGLIPQSWYATPRDGRARQSGAHRDCVLSVARTPCWPRVSLLGASPLRQRSLSRSSLGGTLFRLQHQTWRWKVGCA